MRFIRSHGRIIPIRDNRERSSSPAKAGVAGATVGAGYHLHKEMKANKIEAQAKNQRTIKAFKKMLKPGDILVSGSNHKNAGGFEFHEIVEADVPEKYQKTIKKIGKKLGLKPRSVMVNNAITLPLSGAGNKYHSGLYVGKGKVSHMADEAYIGSLKGFTEHNNVTAYRFENATAKETRSAVEFGKKAAKKKVPYQDFSEYVKNVTANYVAPIKKTTVRNKRFTPMVCHTLPIRAYVNREFPLGEHTMAGQFKHVKGLTPIATRNAVKVKGTGLKALVGVGGRGLKWGVAAAGISLVANRLFKKKERT